MVLEMLSHSLHSLCDGNIVMCLLVDKVIIDALCLLSILLTTSVCCIDKLALMWFAVSDSCMKGFVGMYTSISFSSNCGCGRSYPMLGQSTPFPAFFLPCPFTSLSFALFTFPFFSFLVCFTCFLLLFIPSLSTRTVTRTVPGRR